MTFDKKIALGEFFKELRMARGVKQKDVAREGLSISQLSKFETGQSMLSADRMLIAIEGIHMTFEEFAYALKGYKDNSYIVLSRQISILFLKQDIVGLQKLLEIESKNLKGIQNKILLLVIKSAIYTLDDSYGLEKEDRELLINYLYDIEDWTYFELYIFCNTIAFFSDEDLLFLSSELLKKSKKYVSLTINKQYYQRILLNLIAEMIDRRSEEQVYLFIETLDGLLTPYDTFDRILLNFFKLSLEFISSKGKNRKTIEEYLDSLKIIDDTDLLSIIRERFKQYEAMV